MVHQEADARQSRIQNTQFLSHIGRSSSFDDDDVTSYDVADLLEALSEIMQFQLYQRNLSFYARVDSRLPLAHSSELARENLPEDYFKPESQKALLDQEQEYLRQELEPVVNRIGQCPLDPPTLESLFQFGRRLTLQGRLRAAKDVYKSIVSGTLGQDPRISLALKSIDCLAMLLSVVGYPMDADERQKLKKMERQAIIIANKAVENYAEEGRFADARCLGEELKDQCEKRYGPQDHRVVNCMMNLTIAHTKAGSWSEAEDLGHAVLNWCRSAQAPGHLRTLTAITNLAQVYMLGGRRNEAHAHLTTAMVASKSQNSSEDPLTLYMTQQLAWVEIERGECVAGEKMARQTLEAHIRAFGPESPVAMDGMAIHARGLALLEKWDEAHALYAQYMELAAQTGRSNRVETIVHRLYWGEAYLQQGHLQEAEALIVQSLESSREICGKTHPTTAKGMEYLATLRWLQGRCSEAIVEMELSLEIRRLVLRPGHPDTQRTSWKLQDMKARHVCL